MNTDIKVLSAVKGLCGVGKDGGLTSCAKSGFPTVFMG
jgi:hypothetical protein